MKIGFHISYRGGFAHVVPRALERNCTTIQIFTRNPRRWDHPDLDLKDAALFRNALIASDISPVFVHMPYIVNCASHDESLYERSIQSLCTELRRSELLGARYVIMHAGSAKDKNEGIARYIRAVNTALNMVVNEVVLLIENTPGSGNEFGDMFDELGTIVSRSAYPDRMGVVLDTAHAFAAGYDLHTKQGVYASIRDLDTKVGIDRVHAIHFNDSKTDQGSRYDRHEDIGKGTIGTGMQHIITHPLLRSKPFIMETPRMDLHDDLRNLRTVQEYLKKTTREPR
jgi:deoxyribonuclease-4